MNDEFDHENNVNDRTRHLVRMSKNALITKVLDLEEHLAVAKRAVPPGASFMGGLIDPDALAVASSADIISDHVLDFVAVEYLDDTEKKERADRQAIYDARRVYNRRLGVNASNIQTVTEPSDADWMLDKLAPIITGKVVVEIGAGNGALAMVMAKHAKHVFAIESDPLYSYDFIRSFYATKPANLTFIFDTAESVLGYLNTKTDVAVIVTGSDVDGLRKLGESFVSGRGGKVVMPWQDWKNGRASVSTRQSPVLDDASHADTHDYHDYVVDDDDDGDS